MEEEPRCLHTFTGRTFFPEFPPLHDYAIEDIAHALSNTCRFAGHTRKFYSVAQHSVLVRRRVSDALGLWALLHDASEAYLCDLPTALKHSPDLEGYRRVERRVMFQIAAKFHLWPTVEPPEIKLADRAVLDLELPLLRMDETPTLVPQPPEVAEKAFLREFLELWGRREVQRLMGGSP